MRSEHIDFFKTCAACLNFSLAAKYHFVSVSTLSRGISALEEEIGLKLFERGFHGNRLTDAGRAFFELTMNTTIEYDRFFKKWSDFDDDTLVIGCKPYNNSFEQLITAYSNFSSSSHFSKLKVILIPDDKLIPCLESGMLHVALIEESYAENYYPLSFGNIDREAFCFISKHSLSDKNIALLNKLSECK